MSLMYIDLVTRDFARLPQYKYHMSNQLNQKLVYDVRESLPDIYSNGRPVGSDTYARTALDYSLIHSAVETNRIDMMYDIRGAGFLPSVSDAYGYSFRGQNINLLA